MVFPSLRRSRRLPVEARDARPRRYSRPSPLCGSGGVCPPSPTPGHSVVPHRRAHPPRSQLVGGSGGGRGDATRRRKAPFTPRNRQRSSTVVPPLVPGRSQQHDPTPLPRQPTAATRRTTRLPPRRPPRMRGTGGPGRMPNPPQPSFLFLVRRPTHYPPSPRPSSHHHRCWAPAGTLHSLATDPTALVSAANGTDGTAAVPFHVEKFNGEKAGGPD